MRRFRTALIVCLLLAGVATGASLGTALRGGRARSNSSSSASQSSFATSGWHFHRRIPSESLITAAGAPFSLRSLTGKIVILAPSLSLCHEICPMTTGALMRLRETLASEGLANRVAFIEATVDPWRDSPARLRAYARMTGSRLIQLTGSVTEMRRFWDFFGIGFRQVPQGKPPDVDWWTGRPETFDVEHVDGLFIIDQHGYERVFLPGQANVQGRLSSSLERLLSATGQYDLAHPGESWTVNQVLAATYRLLGVHSST